MRESHECRDKELDPVRKQSHNRDSGFQNFAKIITIFVDN